MAGGNYYKNDSLEFREIILQHLKKILEISTSELRNKTITTIHPTHSSTIEQEDTRISYIQAIKNLAFVLLPYFDDPMKKEYKVCIEILVAFPHEVKELLKEEYEDIRENTGKDNLGSEFSIMMKLHYSQHLFIELNKLLHRNDYLKAAVYGESGGDDDIVDGDIDITAEDSNG